jgi:hypothetical protein
MANTAKKQEKDPGYIAKRRGAIIRQQSRLGQVTHRKDEIKQVRR